MKLSKSFTVNEFERSDYAIKHNLFNIMGDLERNNARLLCENVLQPVRDFFMLPVQITSGFRGKELNKSVGGATTSQHTQGKAADILIKGVTTKDIHRFIVKNLNFDQCILEREMDAKGIFLKGWVHVSYNEGKNRKESLLAVRVNGKTKYSKLEA